MKILLVTYGLNTVGGVQSWQHLFVHEFINRGHNITMCEMYDYADSHPGQRFERKWDSRIRIIRENGPVVQRGVNPKTNLAALKVMTNLINKIRLAKFIKRENFDAILLVDPNFSFFFFERTLRANNCFVQFHSSFDRFKSTSKLRYLLTKRSYHSFSKFIFLSKGDMCKAIDAGFEINKVGYMYNFINESRFRTLKRKDFLIKKQILAVGNLDNPDKQIDHILKAFSQIDKEISKEWTIKIIGEGIFKKDLIALSERLGISNSVEFTGKKSNPAQDYFESSFYVLSSSFEGAPLTLLECVFSNLPPVSYNCSPFIGELIKDSRYGRIVELNNVDALSETMKYLILDPNTLETISHNLNDIKNTFSLSSIASRWENLFKNHREYTF